MHFQKIFVSLHCDFIRKIAPIIKCRTIMKRTILAAITLLLAITLQAQKRVNNRLYNPDPAPVVSGDRLYV